MLVKMKRDDGHMADVHPDMVADYRKGGYVVIEAAADPEIPSKSDIATMKKGDVVEWLEAHGVDAPSGKIGDLRDKLRAIIYVGDN